MPNATVGMIAALARVVHGTGSQHSLDIPFAEGLGVFGRVLRMRIRNELRDGAAHSWNHSDPEPDRACAQREPQVLERVPHTLHDAGQPFVAGTCGDALLRHHQLRHFGAAEQPDNHRHDVDPFHRYSCPNVKR